MRIIGSPAHLPGRSDTALLRRVTGTSGFVASAKTLAPATGLQHGVSLRPIDALHLLAYVTRPRYQDGLRDLYAHWGLLRYLGFFELQDSGDLLPELKLSPSCRSIVGTQRRVASEEMGIAFGALLALRWFKRTGAAGAPISIVDIDAALDARYVFAGAIRPLGARRLDYLLISHNAATPARYRIRVLECKGTRRPGHAVKQLARALSQLDGISVGGRVPAGLATAVITSDDQVSYLAIDPADEEEPLYGIDSEMTDLDQSFRIEGDRTDLPPGWLIGAAVNASRASLADFGGNLGAVERWAPEVVRRRPRDRVRFETPFGTARGTAIAFNFNGTRLTVRYAIDETVDRELSQGDAESVTGVQTDFAARLSQTETWLSQPDNEIDTNRLYSATPDGSIFSLSLE
jgi:hypothetical protein